MTITDGAVDGLFGSRLVVAPVMVPTMLQAKASGLNLCRQNVFMHVCIAVLELKRGG